VLRCPGRGGADVEANASLLLLLTIHQPVAYQNAVGRGWRRSLVAVFELQFVGDSSGTLASVASAHFTDQHFDIRSNPAPAGMRAARPIGQSVQAAGLVAFAPRRDRLTRDAVAFGYLTDGAPSLTSVTARSRISTVTRAAPSDLTQEALG
jgi:hypothetical protein